MGSHQGIRWLAAATGHQFVVDVVPLDPGPYLVSSEPGSPASTAGFRYPGSRSVELPRTGDATVQFDSHPGGCCSIELLSDLDDNWSASYSLVDSEGTVCQTGSARNDLFEEEEDWWDFDEADVSAFDSMGTANGYSQAPPPVEQPIASGSSASEPQNAPSPAAFYDLALTRSK